jgi:putative transposase
MKSHRVGNYITRKIRMYPTAEDRIVLRRWIGTYRRFYNDAVAMINHTGVEKYEAFHGELTSGKNIEEPWRLLLPSASRKLAVSDACDAFSSNRSKQLSDPTHRFEVKFRRRKDEVQQIKFGAGSLKVLSTFGTFGKVQIVDTAHKQLSKLGISFRTSSRSGNTTNADYIRKSGDPILQLDKLNRYYLILRLWESPLETKERDSTVKMVSIDPGVRTFATTYSPDGTVYKLGDRAASRIYRLMIADDDIQGILERKKRNDGSRTSSKERMKLRRSRRLISDKIHHLTDEMHWKIARFLIDRYDHIVIPPFETAKMSRRYDIARQRRRVIGKKTVRQMLRLRHFAFRQKLIYLAGRHGVKVDVLDEIGTTKTCGNCGYWDATIGGKKKYWCPECHVHCDRDVNGSRNVFLKHVEII